MTRALCAYLRRFLLSVWSRQLDRCCARPYAPRGPGEKGRKTSSISLRGVPGSELSLISSCEQYHGMTAGKDRQLVSADKLSAVAPPRVRLLSSADTPNGDGAQCCFARIRAVPRGGPSTSPARAPEVHSAGLSPLRPRPHSRATAPPPTVFFPFHRSMDEVAACPHRSARGGGPSGGEQ